MTAQENPEPDVLKELDGKKDRGKPPASTATLNSWLSTIAKDENVPAERLTWLVASTVVTAVLQRVVAVGTSPRFVLKGGTYINYILGGKGRTTKDVDGIVRGDIEDFLTLLDEALEEDWEPFELSRSEVEEIATPDKVVKPRRLYISLALRGKPWRRIKVEISPDEGNVGSSVRTFDVASLEHLGITSPGHLVGIALTFQIAQKFHACTGPHHPPTYLNDRVRDVVDLVLLRRLAKDDPAATPEQLRQACEHLFTVRAAEATTLGRQVRDWPPVVVELANWPEAYAAAAREAGLEMTLEEAVTAVNEWLTEIASAT